jgi:PAS domain S-box-containing protein
MDDRVTRAHLVNELARLRQRIAELEASEAEHIRQSQANLLALIENTEDTIVSIDRDFRLVTFNSHFAREYQQWYGGQLQHGLTVDEMFAPQEAGYWKRLVARALSGERFVHEHQIERQGELHYYELSFNPIVSGGQITGVAAFTRDVTERRRAIAAMQAILQGTATVGEAFFASLVIELAAALRTRYAFVGKLISTDPARVRTIAVCADGKIVENIEYDLSQTPCETVIGRTSHFYPRDVQQLFPRDKLLADMGVECYLGVPLFASTGQTLGNLVVMHDRPMPETDFARNLLTVFAVRASAELERLQAEEALRESEARWRTLMENAPQFILMIDRAGKILFINHPVIGLRSEDIIGATVYQFIAPDRVTQMRAFVEGVFEQATSIATEVSVLASREAMGWFTAVLSPIVHNGQVVAAILNATDITERKRAEEALRHERDLVARVMETSPVGIMLVNRQGQITFANHRAQDVLGLSRDQVIQRTYHALAWDVTDEQGRPLPDEQFPFRRVMNTGQPIADVRMAIRRADGRRALLSVNATPLFDEAGQADGMVAAIEDITTRERAASVQTALYGISEATQSTHNVDELIRSIHAIIGELMPARNFYIALYDASVAVFHFPYHTDESDTGEWPSIPPGKSLTGYVMRTGKPLLVTRAGFEEMIQAREVELVGASSAAWLGVPLITQQGTIGVMAVQTYHEQERLTESDKDVLVFVSTHVALAIERKQAEEALRASEDKFSTAFHTSPDSVNINRLSDGLYIEINQGFTALTGFTAQDIQGKTSAQINIWADLADRARLVQGLREHGGVTNLEASFRMKDGSIRTGLMSARVIQVNGETCILSITRDITERKLAEEQIKQLNRDLEQRAADLARALERQQELDRLQREFIQNVSHELRTPLALIRGHAEVLESGWLGELSQKQGESIAVISRRAQMLGRLVDDIVSILATERRELKRGPVDLAQIACTSITDFQTAARNALITLTAQVEPDLPPVSGEATALRRLLDNLVGNAFKFTPEGGQIIVRLARLDQTLMLQVADTGIGIPTDKLGRVFERFYQVDGSPTRKYSGVGLGLALVKEIVEAHEGNISVASEEGHGTTFTVLLPALQPPESAHGE